ncbi:hypothetical protein HanRHA438_Chr11g0513201 [Helianthus annuus]|uniref:PHD finger protein ALFIN-LIKE n=1 Tax=Helianthus annuus TaxID=4232 RepID=A0A9K3N0R5_HELAN|nr:hypothetical protein HanXRQr2_Chr11g0500461 [Helianthus annuus]KAJ0502261.1 hypothetical protein HanHA300_Chr11g0410771 [Helianthus annuus]KAJ0510270.1 hypothetical protein HanIR_Chr11g0538791 [Helianthus annuus]KAJ0518184.1 hypothetical protein HanHA89_Chr11g0434451 [Helianthus annuus]KAJ0686215.1 hypothetical protein HanLR1_Chr11g0412101 [Helianthus annuus]
MFVGLIQKQLCLYGHPDETWEVTRGINFARNKMSRDEWLYLVAAHSDLWLFYVAFFYASNLNANERLLLSLCHSLLVHTIFSFQMHDTTVTVHNDSCSRIVFLQDAFV